MAEPDPYDAHSDRYDAWFDEHPAAFASEIKALEHVLPENGNGLEVGVGTGRFAAALGIGMGIDPSAKMRERARRRGIEVNEGVGEELPYPDAQFDRVLLTTTLCVLDDPAQTVTEIRRVLRPGGTLTVGFIDRDSPLGKRYEQERHGSPFYREARFHSTPEVIALLEESGFQDLEFYQTLFSDPDQMTESDPVRPGHGEGGFVVIGARKPDRFPT